MSYLRDVAGTRRTPQSEPIPGSTQVENSAGGYAWKVDEFARLNRWLVLGSEGGSYYAAERDLTRENADAVRAALAADGPRAVEMIATISESGRAPKNDPAILALAMAASVTDEATRRLALDALPRVCRIGTHLFHFNEFVEKFRGRGPALNGAIRNWYLRLGEIDEVAYQMVKYRQRDGWSHRDLLRLVKPKPRNAAESALFAWTVGKIPDPDSWGEGQEQFRLLLPHVVQAFERAQAAATPAETAALVREYGGLLPREALKTEHLADRDVWAALLYGGEGGGIAMPLTALIRNLPTMTRVGLLALGSTEAEDVAQRITDSEALRRSRVHPLSVLVAHLTYAAGRSVRGSSTWQPVARIIDALDASFYAAFGNVEPTGKRHLLALDVSGSMDMGTINGVPGFTPRVASSAMALVTMATGDPCEVVAFTGGYSPAGRASYGPPWSTTVSGIAFPQTPQTHRALAREGITPLSISPRQRIADVCQMTAGLPFGGTDCALPWLYAARENREVDCCVTFTDSESWAGAVHPSQALDAYRRKTGIAARSVVCAMVANSYSVADPADPLQLDVVGFDTVTPQIVADFAAGRI